jgi:hypothetical protein
MLCQHLARQAPSTTGHGSEGRPKFTAPLVRVAATLGPATPALVNVPLKPMRCSAQERLVCRYGRWSSRRRSTIVRLRASIAARRPLCESLTAWANSGN